MKKRCEGMTKPGVFMFASQVWTQCKKDGTVMIRFDDNGEEKELPACDECWQKCIDSGLKILEVKPLQQALKEK